jgi:hypothetical protein
MLDTSEHVPSLRDCSPDDISGRAQDPAFSHACLLPSQGRPEPPDRALPLLLEEIERIAACPQCMTFEVPRKRLAGKTLIRTPRLQCRSAFPAIPPPGSKPSIAFLRSGLVVGQLLLPCSAKCLRLAPVPHRTSDALLAEVSKEHDRQLLQPGLWEGTPLPSEWTIPRWLSDTNRERQAGEPQRTAPARCTHGSVSLSYRVKITSYKLSLARKKGSPRTP